MSETIDARSVSDQRQARWDPLVAELQSWRARVGAPSYGEIADRVAAARIAAGVQAHAARVAKSTVYDVFRTGRARINLDLVREIAAVLGVEPDRLETWVAECERPTPPRAVPEAPAGATAALAPPAPPALRAVVLVLLGAVGLNLLGRLVVDWLHLPIYLDMVGTAVVAIALGPWLGALVGGATNVTGVLSSGWASLPFAIVNIAGALVWGYGVRRCGMGRTLPRFFALNLVVAGVCSLLSVPILVLVFGGSVGNGQDTITQTFIDLGDGLAASVGLSNLLTSGADKMLSGFIALVVLTALPAAFRRGFPLAEKLHD